MTEIREKTIEITEAVGTSGAGKDSKENKSEYLDVMS